MKNKFIIILRHGLLSNSKNITYNRDEVMKKEDIIHLSKEGKKQVELVGMTFKNKKFNIKELWYSPQTRTSESAYELNKILKLPKFALKKEYGLNEVYAPGPYLEKIPHDYWIKVLVGNAYDEKRWLKYRHEKPSDVIRRIDKTFWRMAKVLRGGETGILISHGDPMAWWINYQISGKTPDPQKLRSLIYPKKGQAIVCTISFDNKFIKYNLLNPNE